MGWGTRLLIILAIMASAAVPTYVVARGVCRLAMAQQKNAGISLSIVLGDMLRFLPTAVLYFLVLGIPTAKGGAFFVVPGVLIVCLCALIIPAGIDEQLGPLAANIPTAWLAIRIIGQITRWQNELSSRLPPPPLAAATGAVSLAGAKPAILLCP